MATITAITATAYNITTTWDTGTVPTSFDDVVISTALNVEIPSGYTAEFLTLTLTGVDAANRAAITINGKLNLSGDVTLNSYNEIVYGPNFEIELNGNNIYYVNSGALLNKVTSNTTEITRGKITSSVGGVGEIRRSGGTVQVGGSLNYIDFISTGVVNLASNYYAGDDFEAMYNVFYDCQKITLGGYREGSNSIRVERNDFRATRDANDMCVLSSRLQGVESGGTQSFRFNTFSQGGGVRRRARFEYQADSSDCIFDDVEIYNVQSNSTDRIKTCDRVFTHISTAGGIGNGGGLNSTMIGAMITSTVDNPKIWSQASPFGEISNCVYDPTYELGYTDGGDAVLLSRATETNPTLVIVVKNNLVLESKTGAFINGLGVGGGAGDEITGGVLLEHNTLVGSYDNAYGGLLRTESGGYLVGDTQINSNLIVDISAQAGSLGFNLDFALDDQLTSFDYNNWFQIENPYQGVTSATKTAGVTVGYGGNDLTQDPQFVDPTRNFRQWDLLVGSGLGTTAAGTDELLKLNGYDDTLKTQLSANRTVHSVTSVTTWIADGFKVQNVTLENAGHDGVTIGALAYLAINPAAITFTSDPITDGGLNNTLTTANFVPNITSVKLTNNQNTSLTIDLSSTISGSGDDYTYDSPSIIGSTGSNLTTTINTSYWGGKLEISNGVDTVSQNISYNVPSGWAVQDLGEDFTQRVGSALNGATGLKGSITAIQLGLPCVISADTTDFVDGQDITITSVDTTPDITSSLAVPNPQVMTIIDANTFSIPVNVTAVSSGVGSFVTGKHQERGQFIYPTANGFKISRVGVITANSDLTGSVTYYWVDIAKGTSTKFEVSFSSGVITDISWFKRKKGLIFGSLSISHNTMNKNVH